MVEKFDDKILSLSEAGVVERSPVPDFGEGNLLSRVVDGDDQEEEDGG